MRYSNVRSVQDENADYDEFILAPWYSPKSGLGMIHDIPESDEQVPLWDVALESLLKEVAVRGKRALTIGDIVYLAQQHNIRFDDLMVTLFELVLQGQWQYCDPNGKFQPITRADVNALFVNGRIYPDDMTGFTGSWNPRNESTSSS
jgi:hypothetical protein